MHIVRYMRTNTTMCPGLCVSVVEIGEGDGQGFSPVEVYNRLREDVDSLDGLVVTSPAGDPTSIPNLHKMIVSIKPPRLTCILRCDGRHPDRIDDLLGAGYIDVIDLCVNSTLSKEQLECLEIVRRYNYEFMVTVEMVPGVIGVDEIRRIALGSKGCRQFIMHPFDPRKNRDTPAEGMKGYRKKDLESIMDAVKGIVKNPRMVV